MRSEVSHGMKVRSADGRALGKIIHLTPDGFVFRQGMLVHHDVDVSWDDVLHVDDDTVVISVHRPHLTEAAERAPGL